MIAHRGKFVPYFRVSTDRQGKSGLGLEAQRKAVLDYLNGGSWELVQEFVEVESGASVLRKARPGLVLNEHLEHEDGEVVFRHACKLGLEGIVSKRLGSRYRSGRSPDWLKMKDPEAPAVKREAEEGWGKERRPRSEANR
jgi:hypothetical protein